MSLKSNFSPVFKSDKFPHALLTESLFYCIGAGRRKLWWADERVQVSHAAREVAGEGVGGARGGGEGVDRAPACQPSAPGRWRHARSATLPPDSAQLRHPRFERIARSGLGLAPGTGRTTQVLSIAGLGLPDAFQEHTTHSRDSTLQWNNSCNTTF